MKILFMGTGAADWNIKNRVGDEFFRRFTSIMINDELMIDCNDETIDFIESSVCDTGRVKNILVTHTHSDHYSAEAVNRVIPSGGTVWCEEGAQPRIGEIYAETKTIPLYTPIKIGGFTVTAVEANHSVEDSAEKPLHYIISDGESTIFWGCDGGWLTNREWHELKKHKLDLAVFDGTLHDERGDYRIFEHNNLRMVAEMSDAFKKCGLMKEGAQIMISHMSRYSQYPHEELEEYLKPHCIVPAYDGLTVEL